MALLVASHQDVVLVLALLADAAMRGDAVTVLPVVVPLPLILEAVRPLGDAETTAFIILPLTHVGFCHAGIQLLIL